MERRHRNRSGPSHMVAMLRYDGYGDVGVTVMDVWIIDLYGCMEVLGGLGRRRGRSRGAALREGADVTRLAREALGCPPFSDCACAHARDFSRLLAPQFQCASGTEYGVLGTCTEST